MGTELEIRRAKKSDLTKVAALAGELVRMHAAQDPRRFLLVEDVEGGYRWWFGRELAREDAVLLVAVRGDAIVGYAYGTREERDWNMLLDEHGAVHDIYVDTSARREGVGAKLLDAMIAALEEKQCVRIVLSTMVGNESAQALFRAHGFRPTMLEMTR